MPTASTSGREVAGVSPPGVSPGEGAIAALSLRRRHRDVKSPITSSSAARTRRPAQSQGPGRWPRWTVSRTPGSAALTWPASAASCPSAFPARLQSSRWRSALLLRRRQGAALALAASTPRARRRLSQRAVKVTRCTGPKDECGASIAQSLRRGNLCSSTLTSVDKHISTQRCVKYCNRVQSAFGHCVPSPQTSAGFTARSGRCMQLRSCHLSTMLDGHFMCAPKMMHLCSVHNVRRCHVHASTALSFVIEGRPRFIRRYRRRAIVNVAGKALTV